MFNNDKNVESLKNWLLAIVVIFLLFVGGIFLGILNIEDWTLKEKYEYGTKALTAIGTVFGGIAVFINAFFAAKRAAAMEKTAKAANENAKAANKSAKAANKNAKAAQDKQITERFAKAIEQLASDKIEVRLGAIYTLERIAKDSKEDQWTIMELLTAFVRENAPIKKEEKPQNKKPLVDEWLNVQKEKDIEELPKLRLDIQECLTVIGRREHPDPENKSLDLRNVNIGGANLQGVNFQGANLEGANLQEANLEKAKLQGANLEGANFERANLQEANLKEANLERANLQEVIFVKADLEAANLRQAKLMGAIVYDAKFIKAKLYRVSLKKAELQDADFTEANFMMANLTGANLTGANLIMANLSAANLTEAILEGATMPDGSIHD